MHCLMVWVRMPDGSFAHLPIAHQRDGGMRVMLQDSRREAQEWANYILPERVSVYEEKDLPPIKKTISDEKNGDSYTCIR